MMNKRHKDLIVSKGWVSTSGEISRLKQGAAYPQAWNWPVGRGYRLDMFKRGHVIGLAGPKGKLP